MIYINQPEKEMTKSNLSDILSFTKKFFSKPRYTGSIVPSSAFLGKCMAKGAHIRENMAVVELGPGTGPITAQLLSSGMKPELLYCIEFDGHLCDILKRRFPKVNVVNDSAENIKSIMTEHNGNICAIVSSLPLLSLPKPLRDSILAESEKALPIGGRFVQFTYKLNKKPETLNFKSMRHLGCSKIIANLPPARVDIFEKV